MTEDLNVPERSGRLVRLEALAETHVDGLVAAAAQDRATYTYATVPRERAAMVSYVRALLGAQVAGEAVPFAQISITDGGAIGLTRFLNLRARAGERCPYAVEVGGTWLAASAQRTGINSEAKLLLLTHAFDVWKVGRADFKTDS